MLQRLLVGIDTGGEDGEDRIGMNKNVPVSGHFIPGASWSPVGQHRNSARDFFLNLWIISKELEWTRLLSR